MCVITAPTQELANEMAKACNPYLFHTPLRPNTEMPSYAFPFTPAETPRGQVYEFLLNHVVHTQDGFELVRTRWADLGPLPLIGAQWLESPTYAAISAQKTPGRF